VKKCRGIREKVKRGDDSRIEKDIIIRLAGMVAQLGFWNTKDPDIIGRIVVSSDNDLKHAYDLCYVLSMDGSFNEVKYAECLRIAKEMVSSNWRAIRALAKKVFVDRGIGFSEAIKLIEEKCTRKQANLKTHNRCK